MTKRTCVLATFLVTCAVPAAAQKGPAPAATGLPPEIMSLACAPTLIYEPPPMPLRVTGSQDSIVRRIFAPGDLVTINAGSRNGISVGQEFYTRRPVIHAHERISRSNPTTIRTTGWIRIYAVDENMSLATITHSCEAIEVNDYLEPLVLPEPPVAAADLPPAQRENYGHVLIGQDRRMSFGKGDYLIIDRGSDHGVTKGTRFVLYHDKRASGNFLLETGEAIVVDVKPESSTLQVLSAIDAILAGDYAAMRR